MLPTAWTDVNSSECLMISTFFVWRSRRFRRTYVLCRRA